MASLSISSFAQAQQQLLLGEHEAEITSSPLSSSSSSSFSPVSASTRRALQASGHALTGIVLVNCRTGMGGHEVGEFGIDTALTTPSSGGKGRATKKSPKAGSTAEDVGKVTLPVHGLRVGDVVRVEEICVGEKAAKTAAKGKTDGHTGRGGVEGVVTRVGERSVWVTCGDAGSGKQDDSDSVQSMWGKKIWM
jgi:DNA polymerase alpha-associated DNA helicase A